MAVRLTEPALAAVKNQLNRLLIAGCLAAAGVACVIVGLAYFASSLWHALVPTIGMARADFVLGLSYAAIAIVLLAIALRMVR
jgi:hypothetical protein